MDVGRFTEQALRHVAANRAIIIIPGRWKLIWWLHRLSPSLGRYLGHRIHDWSMRQLGARAGADHSTT